jgi:uncharacterized protein YndB with AHSA1/START domain
MTEHAVVKQIIVKRPPEHVFFCLTDLAARKTWERLEEARADELDPFHAGGKVLERKRLGKVVITVEVDVVRSEAPKVLETRVHVDGGIHGHSVIEVEPAPEGATLVRESFDLDVTGIEKLGELPARIALAADLRRDLWGLKEYAEGLISSAR